MKKSIYSLIVLAFIATSLQAREFNGVEFAEKVTLTGTSAALQLNGVGMRTKFVFDIYAGGLYTEKPAKTRDEVQAQKGPNRIVMHFFYDEVSAEKLAAGWNDGFEENQSDDLLKSLADRIASFNAMFPTLKKADVVTLDYIPGKGTVVTIKGEEKGVIAGEDFNAALLDIWLGEEPADDDLKEAMLGEDD